jgi:hypothetical protein
MRGSSILILAVGAGLCAPLASRGQTAILPREDWYSAQMNAVTDRYLSDVKTDLMEKLDSKTARVGQEVTARIKRDLILADDTRLPKGTMLVGHVTAAQSEDSQQPYASLSITFERADLSNGKSVPVRAVIRSITSLAVTQIVPVSYGDGKSPVDRQGDAQEQGPRPTGLPGVMLANPASGNVSGTLSAQGMNISIANGTEMTMGLITTK